MTDSEKVGVRTINKYTHYVRIPAKLFRELGMHFNRELIIDKSVDPKNPALWEIRLTPVPQKKKKKRA